MPTDSQASNLCRYHENNQHTCQETAGESGLCYWHDPNIIKNNPDDMHKLELYARKGGQLRGICLNHAKLANIDLVRHREKVGFDLSHAELYRADLSGAHLFNINLENASLMKADLREASVHCANLNGCNLLGVKWLGAKIENIHTGKTLRQERIARAAGKAGDKDRAMDYFEQAEEIYRDLRKAADREGLFAMSGQYIRKELTMRRHQMPKLCFKRIISRAIDLFCGYGEAPLRVVGFSLVLILISAIMYFFSGLNYAGQLQVFSLSNDFVSNLLLFLNCIYYSVVTFTTLGYGDFTPIGFSRAIAAFEAFTGSFTIALFVVVFVKKMTR
ncbi:Ion transport 2 domain protein [Shewanella halifaxensis HAW-EB4]|uniref:Ion transport 2 domain protein n=1 Tax=Shewanella halifaxensis (strain HAW-EB4) TaxID=458817 RepID=B0TTP0_SHEHH|nr:ion channel [Shewanella halifaxensis]ABZ75383.1 Ion transport 2 domain protein [Shewanella halifaxensis HAW-EB4]